MQFQKKTSAAATRTRGDSERERGRPGVTNKSHARGLREGADASAFVLQGRQVTAKGRSPSDSKGVQVMHAQRRPDEGRDYGVPRLPAAVSKRAHESEYSRDTTTALPQPAPPRVEDHERKKRQEYRRSSSSISSARQHVVTSIAMQRPGTDPAAGAAGAMDFDVDSGVAAVPRSDVCRPVASQGHVRPQRAGSSMRFQGPGDGTTAWQRLTRSVSAPYDEVLRRGRFSCDLEEMASVADTSTVVFDALEGHLRAFEGEAQEASDSQCWPDCHSGTDWARRFAHSLVLDDAARGGLLDHELGVEGEDEEEDGLVSWLGQESEHAPQGFKLRLSGGLCQDEIPDLTAPGLDDAKALLRSWIDAEDASGGLDSLRGGPMLRESPRGSKADQAPRRPSDAWLRVSPHDFRKSRNALVEHLSGGSHKVQSESLRSKPYHEHGDGEAPDAAFVRAVDAAGDGLEAGESGNRLRGSHFGDKGSEDGGSDDDDDGAPRSRWRALFSRDAVRQSLAHEPVSAEAFNEPIARPTKAWLRRAEDVEVARAPTERAGGGQRCGPASSAAARRAEPSVRVQPRDVLSQLEARHQMLAEKRQQRRASRDSSPSSGGLAGIDSARIRPHSSEGRAHAREGFPDGHNGITTMQDAAFRKNVDTLRAQIRSHSSRLCPRPPVSASSVPKRDGTATAPGCNPSHVVVEAPDSLEQLRHRRMGADTKEASLVEDLARHWSCRARHKASDTDPDDQEAGVSDWVKEESVDAREGGPQNAKEGGGRSVVEGGEWQEMLTKHVEGFSASLNQRLSDWCAKRKAVSTETPSEGEEDVIQGDLVVCSPPDDHPFRRPYRPPNACGHGGGGGSEEVTLEETRSEGMAQGEKPEEPEACCPDGGEDLAAGPDDDDSINQDLRDPVRGEGEDPAPRGEGHRHKAPGKEKDCAPADDDATHTEPSSRSSAAAPDTRALVLKVVSQRERAARASLLQQHMAEWSYAAHRGARTSRKLAKALGGRKRSLCAHALQLLSRHAREEQTRRRKQRLDDGIACVVQRRLRCTSEQSMQAWRAFARREAEDRRFEIERRKRREMMEAVVAAAARSQAPLAAAGSPTSDDAGGAARPGSGTHADRARQPEGAGQESASSSSAGTSSKEASKATAEFHKSCQAIAERHAQRRERRRALDERYRAAEEEKALKQRQAEEARKLAEAEAKAQIRRQRMQEAMTLQEDLNRRLQAKELSAQRQLLASMHFARAAMRWRGLLPWKAAVVARTVALVERWRRRLRQASLGSWRRTCSTTRALLAAARGVCWHRARAQHVFRLLLRAWDRWFQCHVRIQSARRHLSKIAAQAPVRVTWSLWRRHASVAREARLARELRLQAQADEVYALAARRCFLRLWEEASSIARAERSRHRMRQELKGKVSEWIEQYRHQTCGPAHGSDSTQCGRRQGAQAAESGSPPRHPGQNRPPHANSDIEMLVDSHAALSDMPTCSPTQRLIQVFRSSGQQRLSLDTAPASPQQGNDVGGDPVPPASCSYRDVPKKGEDSPESPQCAKGEVLEGLTSSPTQKLINELRCRRSLMSTYEAGCEEAGSGMEGAAARGKSGGCRMPNEGLD